MIDVVFFSATMLNCIMYNNERLIYIKYVEMYEDTDFDSVYFNMGVVDGNQVKEKKNWSIVKIFKLFVLAYI